MPNLSGLQYLCEEMDMSELKAICKSQAFLDSLSARDDWIWTLAIQQLRPQLEARLPSGMPWLELQRELSIISIWFLHPLLFVGGWGWAYLGWSIPSKTVFRACWLAWPRQAWAGVFLAKIAKIIAERLKPWWLPWKANAPIWQRRGRFRTPRLENHRKSCKTCRPHTFEPGQAGGGSFETRWAREPKSKTAHSTPFFENVVVWAAVLWTKSM